MSFYHKIPIKVCQLNKGRKDSRLFYCRNKGLIYAIGKIGEYHGVRCRKGVFRRGIDFLSKNMEIKGGKVSKSELRRLVRPNSKKDHSLKLPDRSVEILQSIIEYIDYPHDSSVHEKCREIPHAENLLEIKGIGENTLSGILAEMGDISRFDDVKEIQKLAGLGLVACSSGKHKGQTKISHRGRKRLRYWLFQAAKSAVSHAEEFETLHEYYTTRPDNPLKKMQSLIVIACKLLRIVFTLLRTGQKYDPEKMLKDIRYSSNATIAQAA